MGNSQLKAKSAGCENSNQLGQKKKRSNNNNDNDNSHNIRVQHENGNCSEFFPDMNQGATQTVAYKISQLVVSNE